jgi:hypothetical protein
MELNIKSFYNRHISSEYIKKLKYTDEFCIICHINELEDEGTQWKRDKLICGHIYHSNCFEKWTNTKQSLNCPVRIVRIKYALKGIFYSNVPLCGDIPCIEENSLCSYCDDLHYNNQVCSESKKFKDMKPMLKLILPDLDSDSDDSTDSESDDSISDSDDSIDNCPNNLTQQAMNRNEETIRFSSWICDICNSKLKYNNITYKRKHFATKKCTKARQNIT